MSNCAEGKIPIFTITCDIIKIDKMKTVDIEGGTIMEQRYCLLKNCNVTIWRG